MVAIQRNRFKKMTLNFLVNTFKYLFLICVCFIILYPIIMMFFRAFMDRQDIFDNTIVFFPKHYSLTSIITAINGLNYFPSLANSIILAILVAFFQIINSVMVGYGFARFNFPLKKVLFGLVIFTLVVPPQLIMSSIFLHFKDFDFFGIIKSIKGDAGLNLLDSWAPSIMLSATGMYIKSGLFIYMFRQSFRAMPIETEEAATVDGAGRLRIFAQIALPNTMNVIVTVLLFSFVWQYNDLFFSSLFIKNTNILSQKFSVFSQLNPYFLERLGVSITDLSSTAMASILIAAAALLVVFPLIVIYVIAQRYFVDGLERSGVVG